MAKKTLRKGLLITFEGPEGCGKSTQSKLLYNFLKKSGRKCVYTREPGGTGFGEFIRRLLLHSRVHISALAELFLFEASRFQIVKEVIKPNLAKKKVVICDRFTDATLSYQGYGSRIPLKAIRMLNRIAAAGIRPDLTVLLDVDTVTGLRRARKKGVDRMEAKAIAYHRRVRRGYLELAKKEPKRIRIVKVDKELNRTQEKIRKLVVALLQERKC